MRGINQHNMQWNRGKDSSSSSLMYRPVNGLEQSGRLPHQNLYNRNSPMNSTSFNRADDPPESPMPARSFASTDTSRSRLTSRSPLPSISPVPSRSPSLASRSVVTSDIASQRIAGSPPPKTRPQRIVTTTTTTPQHELNLVRQYLNNNKTEGWLSPTGSPKPLPRKEGTQQFPPHVIIPARFPIRAASQPKYRKPPSTNNNPLNSDNNSIKRTESRIRIRSASPIILAEMDRAALDQKTMALSKKLGALSQVERGGSTTGSDADEGAAAVAPEKNLDHYDQNNMRLIQDPPEEKYSIDTEDLFEDDITDGWGTEQEGSQDDEQEDNHHTGGDAFGEAATSQVRENGGQQKLGSAEHTNNSERTRQEHLDEELHRDASRDSIKWAEEETNKLDTAHNEQMEQMDAQYTAQILEMKRTLEDQVKSQREGQEKLVKEHEEKILQLESQYKAHLDQMGQVLYEKESEKGLHENQAKEYQKKLSKLKAHYEAQLAHMERLLQEKTSEAEARSDEVENEAMEYQQKLAETQDQYVSQLFDMEQLLRDTQNQVQSLEEDQDQQAQQHQNKLAQMEAQYDAELSEMERVLQETQDHLQAQIEKHEKNGKEYQEQLGKIENKYEAQLFDMERILQESQSQIETLKKEIESLKEEHQKRLTQIESKYESNVMEMEQAVHETQCHIENQAKMHQEKLSQMESHYEADLAEMERVLQETQNLLELQKEKNEGILHQQHENQSHMESQHQAKLLEMRQALQDAESRVEKELSAKEELEVKVAQIESQYRVKFSEMLEALQDIQAQVGELRQERDQALEIAAGRDQECLDALEHLETLEVDLANAHKSMVDANREKEVMQQNWENERSAWEDKVKAVENDLEQANECTLKMQDKLKAKEEALEKCKEKMTEVRTELMDFKTEVAQHQQHTGIIVAKNHFTELERHDRESSSLDNWNGLIARQERSQEQLCYTELIVDPVHMHDNNNGSRSSSSGSDRLNGLMKPCVQTQQRAERRMEIKRQSVTTYTADPRSQSTLENNNSSNTTTTNNNNNNSRQEGEQRVDAIMAKFRQETLLYSQQLVHQEQKYTEEISKLKEKYEGQLQQERLQIVSLQATLDDLVVYHCEKTKTEGKGEGIECGQEHDGSIVVGNLADSGTSRDDKKNSNHTLTNAERNAINIVKSATTTVAREQQQRGTIFGWILLFLGALFSALFSGPPSKDATPPAPPKTTTLMLVASTSTTTPRSTRTLPQSTTTTASSSEVEEDKLPTTTSTTSSTTTISSSSKIDAEEDASPQTPSTPLAAATTTTRTPPTTPSPKTETKESS